MSLLVEINKKASLLDDNRQKLVLEIINNFLPDDNWSDEVYEDDLHYIELARQELADGKTGSWDNIKA